MISTPIPCGVTGQARPGHRVCVLEAPRGVPLVKPLRSFLPPLLAAPLLMLTHLGCGSREPRAPQAVGIAAPIITTEPQDQSVLPGGTATFTVVAGGPNLRYAWSRGGQVIPLATDSTLSVPNVSHLDHGASFSVSVTNEGGTTRSRSAILGVDGRPRIASFTASPLTLGAGQSTTLTWNVADATGLSISGIGAVTGTSRIVNPAVTTTYTLTASNAVGHSTAQVTVTVSSVTGLPQITRFWADPPRIPQGERTTLFWEAANADAFSISQLTQGNMTARYFTVNPRESRDYTLLAHNANGSVQTTFRVTVDPVSPPPPSLQPFETASDRILVAVVDSGPHLRTETVIDTASSQWLIDGVRPAAVHLETTTTDEDAATTVSGGGQDIFPVYLRHRVYLTMSQALVEGRTYRVSTPFGVRDFRFSDQTVRCSSIKVNQVGYHAGSTRRYATFGIYRGDGGSMRLDAPLPYEVIEVASGRAVLTGASLSYFSDDTAGFSGEYTYRADLSAVPPGGPYVVRVRGAGQSWPFGVGSPYSQELARVHARGMYHQRCGIALEQPFTPFTRAVCHTHVAETRTLPWTGSGWINVPEGAVLRPIRGGYHDAGDFDRRPMHTQIPIQMMSMFEAIPSHFADGQYNIPESGNGIPDFLDEALWGMLVWEALQEPDGSVLAGTEANTHPTFGTVNAATDYLKYGTWGALPQVTAYGAGMFAQASRLIRPYDAARADELLVKAQRSWTRTLALKDTLRTEAPQALMYAALQVYLATATGNAAWDSLIPAHTLFRELSQRYIADRPTTYPAQFLPGNSDAWFQMHHFSSYLVTGLPVDATLRQSLIREILFQTDFEGTFFGTIDDDPYPMSVSKYLGWGNATAQGRTAYTYCFAWLFAQSPARRQYYFDVISQLADASLGLNPLGKCFITGLGSDTVKSPLHADSYFTKYGLGEHVGHPKGNVPGILVYGPTDGRSGQGYQMVVSDKLYPPWDRLPLYRRWGDGWSLVNCNEFTTWETMVWNACMHGFLYNASQP